MRLTDSIIRTIYEHELLKIRKRKSFMGIWQIFALATVLKMPVFSVYPAFGNSLLRKHIHRLVIPRVQFLTDPGYIMWTSTRTDMRPINWIPNHFVPVLLIGDGPKDDAENGQSGVEENRQSGVEEERQSSGEEKGQSGGGEKRQSSGGEKGQSSGEEKGQSGGGEKRQSSGEEKGQSGGEEKGQSGGEEKRQSSGEEKGQSGGEEKGQSGGEEKGQSGGEEKGQSGVEEKRQSSVEEKRQSSVEEKRQSSGEEKGQSGVEEKGQSGGEEKGQSGGGGNGPKDDGEKGQSSGGEKGQSGGEEKGPKDDEEKELMVDGENERLGNMACVQWRYVLAIILFLGFILHDCFRTSLSITIVCMVNHGTDNINNSANRNNSNTAMYDIRYEKNDTLNINNIIGLPPDTCYAQEPEVEEQDTVRGDFRWTKKTQGLLLGAVFWGYMALQAPTGWLAEKFGAHRLILVLFTIASISCLCTPAAAYAHPYMLLAIRIVTGMGISVFVPSLPVFWSRWAPPEEWSRMLAVSLSGGLLGIALIFPLGGYMCRHSGGWPSLYYLLGGVGLAWCLAWGVLVRDSPTATPWISDSEKCYIEEATKLRHTKTKRAPIPWLRMMTSRATIAIIATQFFINYGSYMLITQLPTYMKEVMKFNIASNGFYSMLPYLMFFLTVVSAGYLSDLLISRWHFGIGPTRKLLTTVGCLLPACCLMVLALVQCMSHSVAIALLCGAVGLLGISFGGFILNYADIALQFAGTLSGIGNCISTVPGIIAPYIVAVITVNGTRQEWQYAFFTGVAGYVLAAVIFLCFASGDVQPWARPDSTMVGLGESPDDSPVEKEKLHNGDMPV